jgi:hypothetical protein
LQFSLINARKYLHFKELHTQLYLLVDSNNRREHGRLFGSLTLHQTTNFRLLFDSLSMQLAIVLPLSVSPKPKSHVLYCINGEIGIKEIRWAALGRRPCRRQNFFLSRAFPI